MAVAIDTLHNFLRVELPGIPEPVLADGVRKSIQQFFKESESWRHTVPSLLDWTTALPFPALDAGTEIPTDTRVLRVDRVKYASDGKSLRPIMFRTRQQLDTDYRDWEVKTGNTPLVWTNDSGGDQPRIIPIANDDKLGSIKARVMIVPVDALIDLPDFFFYEFEDAFKNGTLARLMKIPGKDWTNFSAAAAYLAMFKGDIKTAKSRANAEYGQPDHEMSYGGIGGQIHSRANDYGQSYGRL